MKCEQARELIALNEDNISGELKRHIAECASCREYLEDIRRTVSLCNSIDPVPLPEDFAQRLSGRLHGMRRTPETLWYKNKKMYASIAGLAACLLIITGPIYSVYRQSSKPFENTQIADSTVGTPAPITAADTAKETDATVSVTPSPAPTAETAAKKKDFAIPAKKDEAAEMPAKKTSALPDTSSLPEGEVQPEEKNNLRTAESEAEAISDTNSSQITEDKPVDPAEVSLIQ